MTDQEFLNQFMPWIYKWANKCQHISNYIDADDLTSVGMMAAFEGRDTFKEGKNTKLNTHIMNMVKFRILRHANSGKEYSLSQNNHILAIQKARRILGDDVTAEEISEWMKGHYSDRASMLIPSTIRDLERVAATKHSSIQAIQEAEGIQPDRYMPTTVVDFEGDYDEKMRMEKLYEHIDQLNEQGQRVMKARLQGKTLEIIGNEMNLTRERIRQIEAKAIRLLQRMLEGNFVRKVSYKSKGTKDENYIADCKRDSNRFHGRDIRRLGNRPREESLVDSGSTGSTNRPGREAHNESEIKGELNGTESGREIQDGTNALRRSSDDRQVQPDRITIGTGDTVRDESVPELESKHKEVESSDLEVLHGTSKRREGSVHIQQVQEHCNDSSNVPSNKIKPGQIVCDGLYEVLDTLIEGLRYEVLILDTGKHLVLKASEIY